MTCLNQLLHLMTSLLFLMTQSSPSQAVATSLTLEATDAARASAQTSVRQLTAAYLAPLL